MDASRPSFEERKRIARRNYYARNRERINERKRAKRLAARLLNPSEPPRYPNTPDGRRARKREWRANLTGEKLERHRAKKRRSMLRWQQRNRERYLELRKRRREATHAERSEAYRGWYARNREGLLQRKRERLQGPDRPKMLAIARCAASRRRAEKRSSPGTFTAKEWADLIVLYQGRCHYCGISSADLEVDHVIPLSRGGAHSIENIVPSCQPRNQHKNTLTEAEYRLRLAERMCFLDSSAERLAYFTTISQNTP